MYCISTKTDKPDIGYMEYKINELMQHGIRVADCNKMYEHYNSLKDVLADNIRDKYKIENPNSSQQIVTFLKDLSNRVDVNSKNDIVEICFDDSTMKWTSKADALEKLSDLGYEFAQDLLDYRKVKKYAETLVSITSMQDANGLIHPQVSLGRTNRVNYSKPGLMTIPKELLWKMIVPYNNGDLLYSVDIKNQEPSILINVTANKDLQKALQAPEGLYEYMFKRCFAPSVTANILLDTLPENRVYSADELQQIGTISPAYYSFVRTGSGNIKYNGKKVIAVESICAGSQKGLSPTLPNNVNIELEDGSIESVAVEWEDYTNKINKRADYTITGKITCTDVEITKAERNEFKKAWNAISYGASSFGIREMCKIIDGSTVYNYITKINELKEYRNYIDKLARNRITVVNTIFGTKLYANSDDADDYKKLKRVLLDLPIQGSGADILSLLIKRFYDYTTEHGLKNSLQLYYTRHDELILEVSKDYYDTVGAEKVEAVIRDMLEHKIDNWEPFKIEVKAIDDNE